jgi:hypothetical protein
VFNCQLTYGIARFINQEHGHTGMYVSRYVFLLLSSRRKVIHRT